MRGHAENDHFICQEGSALLDDRNPYFGLLCGVAADIENASTMLGLEFSHTDKEIKDAYHGTLARFVEAILTRGFNASHGDKLHLGSGVYFYESSAKWAEYWARRRATKEGGSKIAVLSATVLLGRCVNLSDRAHQMALSKFGKEIRRRVASGSLSGQFDKITDAFILNLAAQRSNADTVKAAYGDPRKQRRTLWEESKFDFSLRVVICVRRAQNISDTSVYLIEK